MDSISAIILAGGRGTRLQTLTENKSKSYVSFLGKYRIIDFPLSSISFSKIHNVALLTQYEPYDLMKYIGNGSHWDLDLYNEGISFLTPYENNKNELLAQKGTADALLTQIEYIKKIQSKYILILSGDQLYKIDFRKVLEEHIKSNAKLTILSKDLDREKENLSRFGIIECDEFGYVNGFEEKPEVPKTNTISLGIYLFNKDYLIEILPKASELVDFGKDLIPYIINSKEKVYTYKHDDSFFDLGTVESLYKANMHYLDNYHILNLKGSDFKIYSRAYDYAPLFLSENSNTINSVISDGASIYGNINHSIISYNVFVGQNSNVIDSIILPNAKIGKNVRLKNCLIDENLVIKDNLILEFDEVTLIDKYYLEEVSK